jgi:arginine N-succinyltransferase
MEFPEADSLSTIDKRFIEDLMPKYPIYTCLLSEAAREVLGKVHEQTKPALKMLQDEGFMITDMVDIFDGGPVVHCRREDIGAIRRTTKVVVTQIDDSISGESMLLGNTAKKYRCCLSSVKQLADGVAVPSLTAALLQIHLGDEITVTPQHPTK